MKLRKFLSMKRVYAFVFTAYALGGCVADRQLTDFFVTEFSRLVANAVGQIFALGVSSVTGT